MPDVPEDEDEDDNDQHIKEAPKKKQQKRNVQPKHQIDDDSMRRHEIDRGSDIGASVAANRKRAEHRSMEADEDGESPPAERRDQLYIKEGNAEILRLVTRGKNEADENIYVNVPAQTTSQPQFIMVDNGGKEILMRRFIEEQANGKHIIREHYQIIPGHAPQQQHITHMPNEVHPVHQLHIPPPPPLETYANSQAGSAIYAKITEQQAHQTDASQQHQQYQQQQQNHGSNQSLVHLELETSLKQQNALLRQILLEKEKLEEKYSQHEVAMETQSLPGHSLTMATQTDCEAGTQTDDPYTAKPERRRARSENDDSMSEQDDYELVRYSPDNSPPGMYWVKRKRRKSRPKGPVVNKPSRRRVVLVDDIKRKIRTPIKEENEESVSPPARRHVTETRTSAMRRHRSESTTPSKKTPSKRSSAGLHKEVLMEISDSLDGERSSPEQLPQSRTGRHSRLVRHVEYYEEESAEEDESDNDIVIRRNTYSADSLDDYSGSEELDESHRARGGSRVVHSRQGSLSDLKDPHVVYRRKEEYERKRYDVHTASAIPRLTRKDSNTSSNERDKAKLRGHTAVEAKVRNGAHQLAESRGSRRTASQRQKAQSEADISSKFHHDESPAAAKSVPKYMEWYYSKNQRPEEFRGQEKIKTAANNKKQVGATEKRIKAKVPRSKSEETKFKPEPLPRSSNAQPSSETSRMLREDVQMNKHHAPKIQTDTNHPLLQYSEHRYEREYNPAPDLPPAPSQVSHYMYPETPPSVRDVAASGRPAKPIRLTVGAAGQRPKPSPIREHEVKDFKVVIPIEAAANPHSKQLNASTLEDDHDSGIAMNSLLHSMARRHPITDKKSVFTIAYDDVKVKRIQSESDSPPT